MILDDATLDNIDFDKVFFYIGSFSGRHYLSSGKIKEIKIEIIYEKVQMFCFMDNGNKVNAKSIFKTLEEATEEFKKRIENE